MQESNPNSQVQPAPQQPKSGHARRLALVLLAAALVLPLPAAAATHSWNWGSGDCGGTPGGTLQDVVLAIEPGTEVCVLPPSYDAQFSPRVYVGVDVAGTSFLQTTSPDPRCATVAGSAVTVHSTTICSNAPLRQRGVITYTPGAGPPPTEYDFTYSYKNPQAADAQTYIRTSNNAVTWTEGPVRIWKPNVGGGTFGSAPVGRITYHFPLGQVIDEARLFTSSPTFHWSYSRGHTQLYGSKNGAQWELLVDNPPPGFGGANGGVFNGPLPESLLGGTDLWLRVDLYSYGSSAPQGSVWTNTAQHSRYDVNADNTTFKLDVNFAGGGGAPSVDTTADGNADVDADATVEDGNVTVAVGSAVYANGSAIDPSAQESESTASGAIPFTVDTAGTQYLRVSIGGLMGGNGLFESTAVISARVLEDGVPVATFSGVDEALTQRPLPWGIEEVFVEESIPYAAVPGRSYTLEFSKRLFASATLSPSHAFANFSGSSLIDVTSDDPAAAPMADAGSDATVPVDSVVALDGSGSTDPGGQGLTYDWIQVGGETVTLTGADTATPGFTATTTGIVRFELRVDDGTTTSLPDYVNIVVEGADADADAIEDAADNCPALANAIQLDADGDDLGNACDGDFNQDAFVGGPDFDVFLSCFNRNAGEPGGPADDPDCMESDMNADGFVGGPDFDLFLAVFDTATPSGACGLGFEVAPLLLLLASRRRGTAGRRRGGA